MLDGEKVGHFLLILYTELKSGMGTLKFEI